MSKGVLRELKIFVISGFAFFIFIIIINQIITGSDFKSSILEFVGSFNVFSNSNNFLSWLIISIPYIMHTIIRVIAFTAFKMGVISKYPKRLYLLTPFVILLIFLFHFSYQFYSNKVIGSYFEKISNTYKPINNMTNVDSTNFKNIIWTRLSTIDHGALWYETINFENDSLLIIKWDVVKLGYWFPILNLFGLKGIDDSSSFRFKYHKNLLIPDRDTIDTNIKLDTLTFRDGRLERLYGY